jgi:hypothetical protein
MSARPTDRQSHNSGSAGAPRRILILANEAIGDEGLVNEIVRHTEGRPAQARIVAPALVKSPLALAAGAVDDDIERARRRLDASIAALGHSGIDAAGDVGEADPVLALEDGLRLFPADEVIIVTHRGERGAWLEDGVVERVRREVDVPITVAELDHAEHDAPGRLENVQEVAPAGAEHRARERAEDRQATYFPPMSTRDKVALLLGILGTIALGIASIACADGQAGGHSGPAPNAGTGSCAVPIGLGIGAFIVTVFHGAALLLMRGAGYRGRWEKLTAWSLIAGIPPAVLIGVIFA